MNTVIIGIIAISVIVFHYWACHRAPKYWYLGGIIPLVWFGLLAFLFFKGTIDFGEDWKMIIFPTLIFFFMWMEGHQSAKKKEMNKMKVKDME